jgi:hypothetical protein
VTHINKFLFSLIVLFVFSGLVGCTEANWVSSIKLECAEMCKRMGNPPFAEKIITDSKEINSFTDAIRQADKMTGILDYGAIFKMYLKFENGTEKLYVLNIDDKDGSNGLLVDLAHSEQGYRISKQDTSALRAIIYKH